MSQHLRTHLRAARPLLAVLVLLGVVLAGGFTAGALAAGGADGVQHRGPKRPVIIEVEGDAANGFGIYYSDGTSWYPPTDSETMAECAEYDTRRARIRCRVKNRTWFKDLAQMKRSLAWVRAHG